MARKNKGLKLCVSLFVGYQAYFLGVKQLRRKDNQSPPLKQPWCEIDKTLSDVHFRWNSLGKLILLDSFLNPCHKT